jgi:hypothetical protein
MRVSFTAYADDSIIRGELLLQGDRLSDFIAQDGPFDIASVTVEALDDGRLLAVDSATISRDDLLAITASGPRGNAARRIRTRPHPTRIKTGPFEVVGYIHAPPSGHPYGGVLRRRVLPATSVVISYQLAGRPIEVTHDALLLNPTKIDWLQAASDEDVRLSKALEIPSKLDAHAKDKTGELFV